VGKGLWVKNGKWVNGRWRWGESVEIEREGSVTGMGIWEIVESEVGWRIVVLGRCEWVEEVGGRSSGVEISGRD
jgi:hypothetical protein